jgi:hypothetical protein
MHWSRRFGGFPTNRWRASQELLPDSLLSSRG